MTRILVVEDDPRIASPLIQSLQREGYACEHAADGPTGLRLFGEAAPDVVLLDLMLPGLDGISVCKQIREKSDVPILILSARDEEPDKLLGLETGADDYVTKPFSLPELKARIRALLRRAVAWRADRKSEEPILERGDIRIDIARRSATVKGTALELTPTEFDLLRFLANRPGHVFTRAILLQEIWHYDFEGYERTVDTHVTRLRRKLEAASGRSDYILTVHGVGYKFTEAP